VTAQAHRRFTRLAWAAVLVAGTGDYALFAASAGRGHGWLHQWCSPSALASTHPPSLGGVPAWILAALQAHWPHLLPLLIGIATLVYLRRASVRYSAEQHTSAAQQHTSAIATSGEVRSTRTSSSSLRNGSPKGEVGSGICTLPIDSPSA
jgi:hypothetical protein